MFDLKEKLLIFETCPTRKVCCELSDYFFELKQYKKSLFYLKYAKQISSCKDTDDSGLFQPGILEDKLLESFEY